MNDDQLIQNVHQLVEDIGDEMNAEWIHPDDVLSLDEYVDPNDVELIEEDNLPIDLVSRKINPLLRLQ